METNGRKEIKEAVITAALSAAVVGVVNIGIEELKEWKKRRAAKKEALAKENTDAQK